MIKIMKAKRILLDEFNYELVCNSLRQMINDCQHDHMDSAKQNYQACLGDLIDAPWIQI
jgi:hypothetical protein